MAKAKSTASASWQPKPKRKNKGVHSKNNKQVKKYRGQGRWKKLLEIFKGDKGEFSSKRFVGIIGAFVLFGTMAHNSLSP